MNKKEPSEADIKAKFITPALLKAGWDEQTQIGREVYFTDGRIYVKGKISAREKRKFADYILFYKPNVPIAIVEAKSLTRKERTNQVKKRNYFAKYEEKAQIVLQKLLDKYADDGLLTIESTEVLKLAPLNELGTPVELIKAFGSKQKYLEAIKELEKELYKVA